MQTQTMKLRELTIRYAIRKHHDGEPVIVGTGGLSSLVAPHTKSLTTLDPDLTLKGLALAYVKLHGQRTPPA